MAVYTNIEIEDAQLIFNGLGVIASIEGITEGVENSNFLIQLEDKSKYIFTIFEKRTKEQDLPFFNNAMAEFKNAGINCPVATQINHKDIFNIHNKPCAIYSFIQGRPIKNFNNKNLSSLAKFTANMQNTGLKSSLVRENDMLLPTWKYILEKFKDYEGKNLQEFNHVKNLIKNIYDKFPNNIRKGLIHADLFKDNIFFNDDSVSGVIDFFFTCTDSVIYDLSTLINAWFFKQEVFFENEFQLFFKNYLDSISLNQTEKEYFNFYLKCSAIRFFLTRLHDQYFNNSGQVNHKNPLDFFEILKFHEKNNLQDFF